MLPIQNGMHAIAQHRAQAHPEQPLSQQMFARSRCGAGRVTLPNQIPAQKLSQCLGVDPIGLYLSLRNQTRLVGMGQHYFSSWPRSSVAQSTL
jgi:hypothetical protein